MKRRSFLRRFGVFLAGLPAIPTLLSAGRRPSPPAPKPATTTDLRHLLKKHYEPGILAQFEDDFPWDELSEEAKGRRAEFRL